MSGDYSEEVTPDPIPNSDVKLLKADGSATARLCESRSLPDFISKKANLKRFAFFYSPSLRQVEMLRDRI